MVVYCRCTIILHDQNFGCYDLTQNMAKKWRLTDLQIHHCKFRETRHIDSGLVDIRAFLHVWGCTPQNM